MRSPFVNWEKREKINIDGPTPSITSRAGPGVNGLPFSMVRKCTSFSLVFSFNVFFLVKSSLSMFCISFRQISTCYLLSWNKCHCMQEWSNNPFFFLFFEQVHLCSCIHVSSDTKKDSYNWFACFWICHCDSWWWIKQRVDKDIAFLLRAPITFVWFSWAEVQFGEYKAMVWTMVLTAMRWCS